MLKEGLGSDSGLVMGVQAQRAREGSEMADDESILTNPPTQDVAMHVRDYERFTKLVTRGALTCLVIGFIVLLIL